MDTANLTNKQQMEAIELQSKFAKLTSDSAAENSALQFNAKSVNQVNEWYEELANQIGLANIARTFAVRQYNANETNTASKFHATMVAARDQFNASMAQQINQGNAVWRRNVNTANNSGQNLANQTNAINTLNLSQDALNRVWQKYRDDASWIYNSAENALNRAQQISLYAQQEEDRQSAYNRNLYIEGFKALGSSVLATIFPDYGTTGLSDPQLPSWLG